MSLGNRLQPVECPFSGVLCYPHVLLVCFENWEDCIANSTANLRQNTHAIIYMRLKELHFTHPDMHMCPHMFINCTHICTSHTRISAAWPPECGKRPRLQETLLLLLRQAHASLHHSRPVLLWSGRAPRLTLLLLLNSANAEGRARGTLWRASGGP